MKQENKNMSTYNKIRREFHLQIAEGERKSKQKMLFVALAVLLVASLLLFTAALIETNGSGRYVYVYGESEQKISAEQAVYNGIVLIDFNALANYCQIGKEIESDRAIYTINGTRAEFINGNDMAIINGIAHKMSTKAAIKNGYCLIPLSTVKDLFLGVNISQKNKTVSISLDGQKVYMILNNPEIEYKTDVSKYIEYIKSSDEYINVLVNKNTPIDEAFEPENLKVIPSEYSRKDKEIYLENTAMQALIAMINDMIALGIDDVYVQSSYRSHSYQNMLFNMYVEDEMKAGYSYEEALERANKYSARPEHSEHRTGLCVDFTTSSIGGAVDDVFEGTEAFAWLKDNAWKYGFVLRYPEDKTHITGYQYESWHYRFVGLERAMIMYQTGMCYEEYLEYFGNK